MLIDHETLRRDHGFTLIELVVAMVLLVVVMSGLVYGVMQLGRGNSEAMTDRKAQREALDTMEQLRLDVRAARSPALDQWDGRRENLRDVIAFGRDSVASGPRDPAHAVCGSLAFTSCVQDITFASGSQLWFRSDTRFGAGWDGTECIGYVRSATGLTRYESTNWRNCRPGAGGTETKLITARNVPARVFTYSVRFHPGMVRQRLVDPAGCRTYTRRAQVPDASIPWNSSRQLNFINAIDIDLRGITVERGTAATAGLQTSVPVTSRTTGDYAYATGCSY
jgi:prepilin-type N-terminal cleavage/methylation domain-containing protein